MFSALADCSKRRAIIARRSRRSSGGLLNSLVPATRALVAATGRPGSPQRSGGSMTFYDPTLYGRDEEDEFADSGAYSESLEEDFEEEEEEEAGLPEPDAHAPAPVATAAPPAPKPAPKPAAPKPPAPAGGGGGSKPAAKKKAAKKPAEKAKKKAAAKKPAKKKGKKRR